MALLGACILVGGFILVFGLFKIAEKSRQAIKISKMAIVDLRDCTKDDDVKEAALQIHAKRLFVLFFDIFLGGLAAVSLPLALVWLLEQLNMLTLSGVLDVAFSWQFLSISTAVITGIFWLVFRRGP